MMLNMPQGRAILQYNIESKKWTTPDDDLKRPLNSLILNDLGIILGCFRVFPIVLTLEQREICLAKPVIKL